MMLTTCSEPGCATLVMGGRCLEHESPQARAFVRGRPFAVGSPTVGSSQIGLGVLAVTGGSPTLDYRTSSDLGVGLSRS